MSSRVNPLTCSMIFVFRSRILRGSASGCFRMFPDAPRCSQMLPDAPRCSQMYPNAPRCCQMLPDVARCCQMHRLPDAPRCCQMLPDVPRCSQMLSVPILHFPIHIKIIVRVLCLGNIFAILGPSSGHKGWWHHIFHLWLLSWHPIFHLWPRDPMTRGAAIICFTFGTKIRWRRLVI